MSGTIAIWALMAVNAVYCGFKVKDDIASRRYRWAAIGALSLTGAALMLVVFGIAGFIMRM